MTKANRVESIDALRGGCTALMVFANNPGSRSHMYKPLEHADWNGFTLADVGFPLFLFVAGLSMAYGLRRIKEDETLKKGLWKKILTRSAILFCIGLFLNGFPFIDLVHGRFLDLHTLRIPGVLQRIAIVGLVTTFLYLYMSWRALSLTAAAILLVYWFLLCAVPVPGVGPANMEPNTNLAAWLDNYLLHGHLWAHSQVWDPEGILSTLPAIPSCIAGVLAGVWLQTEREQYEKLSGLLGGGVLAILGGIIWNAVFPINKSLWTSPYVLVSSGCSLFFLALSFWVIDIQRHDAGWIRMLKAFGLNAITAYGLSEMLVRLLDVIPAARSSEGETVFLKVWLFDSLTAGWISPLVLSLMLALACAALVYAPLYAMYKRNIVVKF